MEENSAPLSHQKWMLAVEHPQSQAQMILVDAACPSHIRPLLGSGTGLLVWGRLGSGSHCKERGGSGGTGRAAPRRGRFAVPGAPLPSTSGPAGGAEVTASVGSLSRGKMAPVAVLGSAEGKQV